MKPKGSDASQKDKLIYVIDGKETPENYEPVDAVQDTCTYDTKWDYQNEALEKRYQEFKLRRDKFLLEEVPESKKKIIQWTKTN